MIVFCSVDVRRRVESRVFDGVDTEKLATGDKLGCPHGDEELDFGELRATGTHPHSVHPKKSTLSTC
jgi:hypothetical protein